VIGTIADRKQKVVENVQINCYFTSTLRTVFRMKRLFLAYWNESWSTKSRDVSNLGTTSAVLGCG